MKNIIILLLLPLVCFSQHNWKANRDLVIGVYEGYQTDSTAWPDIKVPFSFTVKYTQYSLRPVADNDTSVSIDPKNLLFKVRNDSLLVLDFTDQFWFNKWGKFHPDSTLEFLYIEPFRTGGHRVYTWGKMVQSYVATEDLGTHEDMSLYPNPSSDYLILDKLFIESKSYVSVVNIRGQTVMNSGLLQSNKLDISALEPGLYYLIIRNKNKIMRKSFIKI